MSKTRVYELAKELNIESKKLVEKLHSGGLAVKNYMSTLDENEIRRAKDIVSGAEKEVVEEKRVKPRVIRRRKRVKPAEVPAGTEEKEAHAAQQAPAEPESVPELVEKGEEKPGKALAPEPEAPEAPKTEEVVPEAPVEEGVGEAKHPEAPAAEPVDEKKPEPKKPKRRKGEQPAKIIKTPAKIISKEPLRIPPQKRSMEPEPIAEKHPQSP